MSLWLGDYPGGPVVKQPSCSAGDMGSSPNLGTKIPQALEQLNPHAAMVKPL